jgi:BirA family biotin operon repressor/biotin-[acetyl-CoA-carboxylase] ligase
MSPIKSVYQATLEWLNQRDLEFMASDTTQSTNLTAKEEAFYINETIKLYTCNRQTKGRGRGQNTWLDAREGASFISSWSYSTAAPAQAIAAPLFGLATYEALINTWSQISFSIKAPNDIYIKNRKTAGLLVESLVQGSQFRIVVGLGLNVLDHPREIKTATHIAENAKEFITLQDWNRFLNELSTQYSKALLLCLQTEIEASDRVLIKHALNRYPGYNNGVQDVSPQGDIIFKDKVLSWTDL